MRTHNDEVAMNFYYLVAEVLKALPEGTGDLFGIGEDDFVMELYPYAELVVKLTNEAYDNGKRFSGLFVFDAMEELGACFAAQVMRQDVPVMEHKLPDMDEWELDILRVIESSVV